MDRSFGSTDAADPREPGGTDASNVLTGSRQGSNSLPRYEAYEMLAGRQVWLGGIPETDLRVNAKSIGAAGQPDARRRSRTDSSQLEKFSSYDRVLVKSGQLRKFHRWGNSPPGKRWLLSVSGLVDFSQVGKLPTWTRCCAFITVAKVQGEVGSGAQTEHLAGRGRRRVSAASIAPTR